MGKISSESRLIYDSDPFGTGTFSVVYKGTFNRESVAIKRVQKHNLYTNDSQKVVMRVLDHRNVVKLLFMEDEKDFRCFALELCAATLHDYCTGKFNGTMPEEWDCLLDMADGLQYIHSKNIVHGDIKPRNILISLPDEDGSVRMKISDFGLCRQISERYRFSLDPIKGAPIYLAPEVLQSLEKKASSSSCSGDVFSLGCTYFFFLTKGTHPFGSTLFLSGMIPKATRNTSKLIGHPVLQLIRWMISRNPENRPPTTEVVSRLLKLKSDP